ncbi:hypothetical protein F5Y19DRAFT_177920 [Xylariaceae sp. FL1651]|nr:hypothetical protein F5Y19DRAFT_177920 [Xylariaceae sp. FL1651]
MFSSWKLDARGELTERPQVFDPLTARTLVPQACTNCRARKIKCNGDKRGCYRCTTLSQECIYTCGDRKKSTMGCNPAAVKHTAARNGARLVTRSSPLKDVSNKNPHHHSPVIAPLGGSPTSNMGHTCETHAETIYQNATETTSSTAIEPIDMSFLWHPDFNSPASAEATEPPNMFPSAHSITVVPSTDIPPCFGFHPATTPNPSGSLSALALAGTESVASPASHPTNRSSSSTTCRCLNGLVLLMDEVESLGTESLQSLDAALATHKDALRHGKAMLECASCAVCVESMMMLTFFADTLADLCQRIASATSAMPSSTGSTSEMKHVLLDCDEGQCAFGSYTVHCLEEYYSVVKGLLGLHVRELLRFLDLLKHISQRLGCRSMVRRLEATESATRAIEPWATYFP